MSGCAPCKARQQARKYLAVDRLTGDCLMYDPDQGCVRYATPMEARTAALEAGHTQPGIRRVSA